MLVVRNIENEQNSLGVGTAFQYFGSTVTLLSGALFYVFLVKSIPQDAVGAVTLFQSILGLFATIFAFGLPYAGRHLVPFFMARKEMLMAIKTIRLIIVLAAILTLLATISILCSSGLLTNIFYNIQDQSEKSSFLNLSRMLFIVIGLFLVSNIINGIILGLHNYKQSGIAMIAAAGANYGIPFVMLVIYTSKFEGTNIIFKIVTYLNGGFTSQTSLTSGIVVAGWIIGYSISVLIYIFFLIKSVRITFGTRMKGVQTKSILLQRIMDFSFPMFLSSIVTFGSLYIDRFAVAMFLSPSQLAVYNLGLIVATSVIFFINPINIILLPKISQYFGRGDNKAVRRGIRMATSLITFIYVPIALFAASVSKGILLVLGNSNYVAASIPFSIILVTSAVFVMQTVLTRAIAGVGRTRVFILSSSMTLVSNLTLSMILIPRIGLIGASIAYSSVYVINFLILYHFASKFQILNIDLVRVAKIWLSSVIMFAVIFILYNYVHFTAFLGASGVTPNSVNTFLTIIIYILIGFLIFFGTIRISKGVVSQDVEFIYKFVPTQIQFSKRIFMTLFSNR